MKTIVIINQKGGVAKTTTAAALGQGLLRNNKTVLFIDLDAQGSLTDTLTQYNPNIPGSIDVLEGKCTIDEAIVKTPYGALLIGSPDLADADLKIVTTGKEYRLKEALGSMNATFDYVIIDTPPHLGIVTVNALTAADNVIIPTEPSPYCLKCVHQLWDTIQTIQKYCNPNLTIGGLLITRYNQRATLNRDIADLLHGTAKSMRTKVYETKIRETVAVKEAALFKESVFTYGKGKGNHASADYAAFVQEVLKEDEVNG